MLLLLVWQWVEPTVLHSMMPTNWVPALAAVSTETGIPGPSALEQYGPGGVIATIALALMWAERRRAEKAEQEIRDLNKQFRDQVVPLLTQFTTEATRLTQATTEAIQTMTRQARERERDR